MTDLSTDQQNLRNSITRSSTIWGVIAGLIVFGLAFWLAGGLGELWRWVVALALGGGAGWFARRGLFSSGAAKAKCGTCGTPFSIREVERREHLVSSEPKRETQVIAAASGAAPGRQKVTTWTAETVEVTAIDECAKCHARTERKWTTTRERDKREEEVAIPAPAAGPGPVGAAAAGRARPAPQAAAGAEPASRLAAASGGPSEPAAPPDPASAPSRLAAVDQGGGVPPPAPPAPTPPEGPARPRGPGGPRGR